MLGSLFQLARPLLYALEPERAHELTLRALEAGLYWRLATRDQRLETDLWGLTFPNPVGVAAGFDKDARVPDAVLAMGFGFTEIGTVTPLPQEGNERPRVFRLVEDRAVINRLGFNNAGHAAVLVRLRRRAGAGIVGVNLGAGRNSPDPVADFVAGIETFYGVASYFTINISSPNTPGLRDLQVPAALDALLLRVMDARAKMVRAGAPQRPVVVKLAPDILEAELEPIAQRLLAHGVDGIAISNTTLAREGLKDAATAKEAGGLSGRPLFRRSTALLARMYRLTGGRIPLIGIGGIECGTTAIAKIEAGASLVQLYTGLLYQGPGLIGRITRELVSYADRHGLRRLEDARGRKAEVWSAVPLSIG
jgi:dihydroorotate dehydrogenase